MVTFVLGNAGSLWAEIRAALWRYRYVLLLTLVHMGAAAAVVGYAGGALNFAMAEQGLWFSQSFVVPYLLLFAAYRAIAVVAAERPARPLAPICRDLLLFFGHRRRLVEGLLVVAIFVSLMGSFSQIKDHIPLVNPFSWDEAFYRLDRILFLGHDPWRLLWPLLGSPEATFLVNLGYNMWLFVTYFLMITVAFSQSDPQRKLAFVFGFVLVWTLGGNLLAILFSSAGPVYYERLGLGTAYVDLMAQLRANAEIYPVWALGMQETLWNSYAHAFDGASGISAMPSMHNASTVFMALFAFRVDRRLGWLMAAFAALIFVGSIHLGWHYAVDGLLGALVAHVCWRCGLRLAAASLRADLA